MSQEKNISLKWGKRKGLFSKRNCLVIFYLFLFLWVVTLGIHIEMDGDSECQQPVGYTSKDFKNGTASMTIYAYLNVYTSVTKGVPYLFSVSSDKLPNDLHLVFSSDKATEGDVVSITYLRITHNPKESYILVPSEKPIKASFDFYDDRGSDLGYKPHYTASIPFFKTIKYRSSFELHIKGEIQRKEGIEQFDQKLKVKYIRNRAVYPGWFMLYLRCAFG